MRDKRARTGRYTKYKLYIVLDSITNDEAVQTKIRILYYFMLCTYDPYLEAFNDDKEYFKIKQMLNVID